MKKISLVLVTLFSLFFWCTFAITQKVNETNGINYGFIKNIYQTWSTYYLAIDYIQIYQWYDAALARAEDGEIFWTLSTDYNQNYPVKYYTTDQNSIRTATKTIRKKITAYLVKIGKKWLNKILNRINNYSWDNSAEVFNTLTEMERMIVGPSFDPATWWWWNYTRNTNPQIRTIPFSPSARIIVEEKTLTLSGLVAWQQNPTQRLVKIFLQWGKIEWFNVAYHP